MSDTKDHSLTAGIELLVDHLRVNRSREVSLGDIAAVTEILLTTMQRYFSSLDTSIYSEFRILSERIGKVRSEIAEITAEDVTEDKIPRAGKELEAIVASTEDATSNIMDAAEEIMSADPTDLAAYQTQVNDACMRIFEACSFQDITGQRITKVVNTLTFIEDRLQGLETAWGQKLGKSKDDADIAEGTEEYERRNLLRGPALDGEGIDQSDVDSLFGGDATAEEIDAKREQAAEVSEKEKPAKKSKPVAEKPEEDGAPDISQDDIDALFD